MKNDSCKCPRWEKIYYAKVLELEIEELLPIRKIEAYSKVCILTYAILLAIFPRISLFRIADFMLNFG